MPIIISPHKCSIMMMMKQLYHICQKARARALKIQQTVFVLTLVVILGLAVCCKMDFFHGIDFTNFYNIQHIFVCETRISKLLQNPKLNSILSISKPKLAGCVLLLVCVFCLGGYSHSCRLENGCEYNGKRDILIKSGYIDRYVEDLVLNSSRILQVKSCRRPA
jgi:hypothetical protein